MPRSFIDKHDNHKHPAHIAKLDKPMWGLKRGQTIVIATPKEVSAFFKRVPAGKTRSMDDLRAALAKKHGADAACPLTSGIFARIAAEAALERMEAGAKPKRRRAAFLARHRSSFAAREKAKLRPRFHPRDARARRREAVQGEKASRETRYQA